MNAPDTKCPALPTLARPWFDPATRRRVAIWAGVLSLALVLFVAFFSVQGTIPAPDRALSEAMQEWGAPGLTQVSELVSIPGYSPWNAGMGAVLCILMGVWLHPKVGAYLFALTILQGVAGILLKFPIRQERPGGSDVVSAPLAIIKESSFPSGHTMMYIVLLGFVVYLLWRYRAPVRLRWAALLATLAMVALVGPARLHLGAHWVGDVVAAYTLGFFLLLLGIDVYEQHIEPHVALKGKHPWP